LARSVGFASRNPSPAFSQASEHGFERVRTALRQRTRKLSDEIKKVPRRRGGDPGNGLPDPQHGAARQRLASIRKSADLEGATWRLSAQAETSKRLPSALATMCALRSTLSSA